MTRPIRQIFWPAAVLCTAIAGVTPAAAQSAPPRTEISANVGALAGASKFTESGTFPSNGGETATVTAAYGVKTAVAFNAGAAVRIVPRLWVGVQYAMADTKPSAAITAAIPHPILFNAPRSVEGSFDDVAHNEQNVHVDLMYALPVAGVDLKIMGGPTVFTVKQDFISGVTVNETFPFDTATFAGATTTRVSKTGLGFNAGLDISRPLSSRVGVGALIRYSRGNIKFNDTGIGRQTVKAGGVEAGAGVRVRF
jgi:hypothetical protein